MKCPNCGEEAPAEAVRCPSCGKLIMPNSLIHYSKNVSKSSAFQWPIIIGGGVVLFIVVSIVSLYLLDTTPNPLYQASWDAVARSIGIALGATLVYIISIILIKAYRARRK